MRNIDSWNTRVARHPRVPLAVPHYAAAIPAWFIFRSPRGMVLVDRFADWVTRQVDSFMVRGTRGPMQWMLDLRMYGLKVHYNSTTPGHVTWMGQDELLLKDIAFTKGDFRGFIHGLVNVTRQILREQLLLAGESTEVPAIPWDQLRDDPTQAKAGWNFWMTIAHGGQWLVPHG